MHCIHTLKDLNQKTAEIESVNLLRELKRFSMPLSTSEVHNYISQFYASETDLKSMEEAINSIPATINLIQGLSKVKEDFELINFQRAIAALNEIAELLKNNLAYTKNFYECQNLFAECVTNLFNAIPLAEDKKAHNEKISKLFEDILRSREFSFNYEGVISDGAFKKISNLAKSMEQGFFCHTTIEEHLKKINLDYLLQRFSKESVEKIAEITNNIKQINKGVEKAYNHNMRMLNLAVVLYAFIKLIIKGR